MKRKQEEEASRREQEDFEDRLRRQEEEARKRREEEEAMKQKQEQEASRREQEDFEERLKRLEEEASKRREEAMLNGIKAECDAATVRSSKVVPVLRCGAAAMMGPCRQQETGEWRHDAWVSGYMLSRPVGSRVGTSQRLLHGRRRFIKFTNDLIFQNSASCQPGSHALQAMQAPAIPCMFPVLIQAPLIPHPCFTG